MKCMHCGFENPEMSKFCGKCGKTFGGEKTSEKQKETGKPSYMKFVPVAVVLIILLVGVVVIAPNLNKAPGQSPTSADSTDTKTSESSSPSATSKSLIGTASPTQKSSTASSSSTWGKTVSKNAILEPINKESAGMDSSPYCCGSWYVGDYSNNRYIETFLSFSMTDIPADATITNTTLDFSDYSRSGDPFSYLGCMGIYEQSFGAPDATDFFFETPTDPIVKWCTDRELSKQTNSKTMASAMQKYVGKDLFQVRVQFETNTDDNKQDDKIYLSYPKIIVTYTVP